MSTAFALSAIGHALRFRIDLLTRATAPAITGNFTVVSRPPATVAGEAATISTIVLYPYHLSPTPHRNDRPRSGGIDPRTAAPLALDVRYLLTVYAADTADADMLLGTAILALHDTAVLTPEMLEASAGALAAAAPLATALRDLAQQPASINVTPLANSDEGLSQLWTALGTGRRSAMTYQASTILIG